MWSKEGVRGLNSESDPLSQGGLVEKLVSAFESECSLGHDDLEEGASFS